MIKSLISVVILTYNGEEKITTALNSVFRQTYDNIEVIIVDNASKDGTIEKIQKLKIENQKIKVKIIKNKENIGFAGHNIGIGHSKGEFIFCMNQDVVLDKDFIANALMVVRQDKKIGALQPKMMDNKRGNVIDSTGIVIFKSRRMVDRGQGEEDKGQYNKTEEVFGVNGAAAFFRKKCLEEVKLPSIFSKNGYLTDAVEYYDPDFFMYKEDVDISWRIRLFGWKVLYCPTAIVYTDRTSEVIGEKSGIVEIIKTRRRQKQYVRHFSFINHHLAIIKNDLPWLFFKHLPWILPREIGIWLYVIFFERKTWPAIRELFRKIPREWRKRKIIMRKKRVAAKDIEKWFV